MLRADSLLCKAGGSIYPVQISDSEWILGVGWGVVEINLFLNLKAQPETTLLCEEGLCQEIA